MCQCSFSVGTVNESDWDYLYAITPNQNLPSAWTWKDFYKKFLAEGLPIESHLSERVFVKLDNVEFEAPHFKTFLLLQEYSPRTQSRCYLCSLQPHHHCYCCLVSLASSKNILQQSTWTSTGIALSWRNLVHLSLLCVALTAMNIVGTVTLVSQYSSRSVLQSIST